MHFLLSNGGCPILVKKTEVELVMKLLHPTSIGNTLVIHQFLTHCSRRSSYFPTYFDVPSQNFLQKGPLLFFALTDQMTIFGRFVVDAISRGNMKLCFKSVATSQSSSNDGLRIFLRASFEIFPSLTN